MGRIKQYLEKQGIANSRIKQVPAEDLGLIVVIPAFKETDITATLVSLFRCSLPTCGVEILVLINGSDQDPYETRRVNESSFQQCLDFQLASISSRIRLHVMQDLSLPVKKAGVGLARKILMDEACARFLWSGNEEGIIANLDADCTVAENYFQAILHFFSENQRRLSAASIRFSHELDNEYIVKYELHLRYFIGMQRWLELPFAFQTVGSAMAVRISAYAAVGGMNTRKAGEDFYFIHKFVKNQVCGNLNATYVFPSGRVSDRVPFGTGRAVGEMIERSGFTTYNPRSFLLLRPLIMELENIYGGQNPNFDPRLSRFLESINFKLKVAEIRKHTKGFEAFCKRFYQYFDAFTLMKYLHFVRDMELPDVALEFALPSYFEKIGKEYLGVNESSLEVLRRYDGSF